ncbi:hypothetical protein PQR63_23210 [Herbaspirillum rhizosphaerae]|uniref:Uncharacterized protein n=1 Tax=Herbaspirillum rhizosphaerae TaxID=346179 RepID=A0ABW8ZFK0_9BURK
MSKERRDLLKALRAASPIAEQLRRTNELVARIPKLDLPAMSAVDLNLAPVIKMANEMRGRLDLQFPVIGNALKEIQKSWQMPLAINAFSASLGFNEALFKLPKWDFPKIDFDALHERDERALRFASLNNWFIQPEAPYSFARDIDECGEDVAKLDQFFIQMISSLKTEILERLKKDHPEHSPLIAESFRLHDEGRYLGAIPLAMISAEGIAYSVSEKSIFNSSKNRPEIASWLDKQPDLSKLAKAFLASLSEQHPMSKPRPGKLNRHRVLHGKDTAYDSELFSLQAISLLGFVGWAFAAEGLVSDKRYLNKGEDETVHSLNLPESS